MPLPLHPVSCALLLFARHPQRIRRITRQLALALGLAVGQLPVQAQGQAQSTLAAPTTSSVHPGSTETGPVQLRQTAAAHNPQADKLAATEANPLPYVPGEFELYVRSRTGGTLDIRRLGADLLTGSIDPRATETSPLVPPDYAVAPGDEVLVTLWGGVEADLRLVVDKAGRIQIPRVGAIQVAGVRSAELQQVVAQRVAQTFRNFQLSVTVGQLRGIRVFVTGFVLRPGAHTVSSLSTVLTALLRSGGPSAAGSFRDVTLRRGGKSIAQLDLYDLVLRGDSAQDHILQAGDVVHVGQVGAQVAVVGSVNKPVVAELKVGDTVADAIRMAGGFAAVADRSRLQLERLEDRGKAGVVQLAVPADLSRTLSYGDIVRVLSAIDFAIPGQRQSKRVRVEGEVSRPGEYVLPANSSVNDAVRAAGGMTTNAFVFGAEFTREKVLALQQQNYDRALRELETDIARNAGSQRVSSAEQVATQASSVAGSTRLLERLRQLQPSGRLVLQLEPDSDALPDLALEDGDRIYIPPRPSTVGVFGSVFNAATYLYSTERSLEDYLRLAGGPTKGADESSMFVVRANGNVVSARQGSRWSRNNLLKSLKAQPGDTVFVPEEMDKTTLTQSFKDWTQIVFQLGVGLASIVNAAR
jgi:protein involved in polysaccharide export with SLBB domain